MISVIIRTYNEAAHIEATLAAVAAQDGGDVEVIVVDSGSLDDTVARARRHGARLLTMTHELFSYGYALNVGADAARGEILVALSAHARPANRAWLRELVDPLGEGHVAGVASKQLPFPGQRLESYLYFWHGLYAVGVRTPLVCRYLYSNASAAFRRALWQVTPFDETVASCEDHLWALQMQRAGLTIAYAPASRVFHSHATPWRTKVSRGWAEVRALSGIYHERSRG